MWAQIHAPGTNNKVQYESSDEGATCKTWNKDGARGSDHKGLKETTSQIWTEMHILNHSVSTQPQGVALCYQKAASSIWFTLPQPILIWPSCLCLCKQLKPVSFNCSARNNIMKLLHSSCIFFSLSYVSCLILRHTQSLFFPQFEWQSLGGVLTFWPVLTQCLFETRNNTSISRQNS
jgi:hypothetical protein